jgi:hypothetical protein
MILTAEVTRDLPVGELVLRIAADEVIPLDPTRELNVTLPTTRLDRRSAIACTWDRRGRTVQQTIMPARFWPI